VITLSHLFVSIPLLLLFLFLLSRLLHPGSAVALGVHLSVHCVSSE